MIPKLLLILMLTIQCILSEEPVQEKQFPNTSLSSGTRTQEPERIAEERSASFKLTTEYSITNLNGSSYQLHPESRNADQIHSDYISQPSAEEHNPQQQDTVDDLEYLPVVRYETQNNHSQVREQIVLGKNGRESRQPNTQLQSGNKTRGKSKGFIEFEFDIDDGVAKRENNDEIIEETKASTSSLKQIFSSIFPQRFADIFRFSYVAKPPRTKARLAVQRYKMSKLKENNQEKQIIVPQSSSLHPNSESAPSSLPQVSPSVLKIDNNSTIVTNDDVRNINNAAENMQETSISVNQNRSEPIIPFGEPINVETMSDSDYEDHNLNLDEDNLIASSQISSNRIYYPHPSEHEKEINVQIIQDTLGGYGQKIVAPETRNLDDFQEEVEKQFSPNDIRSDSEAPSRKFLRNFKEKINNKSQSQIQSRRSQPESLLHTYVYSSDNSNGSFSEYEAPPAGSIKQGPPLPDAYNSILQDSEIIREPLKSQNGPDVHGDTQAEENREAKEISHLHTEVFHHKDNGNIFVTRGHQNQIDGFIESTTPFPRFNFKPSTVVEIQKSVNIHNKFITEKNGNLVEQHEIYSRPQHLANSPGHLQLVQLTTQPSLLENPIRVAQAEESLQNEAVVHPEVESSYQQDSNQEHEPIHQENLVENPYQKDEKLYQTQQLPTGQQHTRDVQKQQLPYHPLEQYHNLQSDEDRNYQQLQQDQQQTSQYQQAFVHEYQSQGGEQVQQQREQLHQYQDSKDTVGQEFVQAYQAYDQQQQHEPEHQYQQDQSKQRHQYQQQQYEQVHQYEQQHEQEIQYQQQQAQEQQQQQQQQPLQQQQNEKLHEQYQFEYAIYNQPQTRNQVKYETQQGQQNPEPQYSKEHIIEKHVPYPVEIERVIPQPYPVEKLVEKIIDRPVPVERIVEKQVNVPYPVREVVEKIIDRPVPVEKIVDRPVHIPYPVQVDHFIDRPYPVQVPIPVAVPVAVHRYIDRPYPVEKIIEKPIHVPYPVEKVVEKIVEKHVPVEVERIVEKPIETIVEKQVDRPVPIKQFIPRPVPVPVPVPVGVPVAITLSKQKDKKKRLSNINLKDIRNDFIALVPPPLPSASGNNDYKTITDNIHFLLVDDYNRPLTLDHQLIQLTQPVKRNIKRSPEFGRNLRVEYGFKPPLVPSLEIDDQGLPLTNKNSGV